MKEQRNSIEKEKEIQEKRHTLKKKKKLNPVHKVRNNLGAGVGKKRETL